MKIDLSCPIEIISIHIENDGVGTLRLLNLSPKTIASVEVSISTDTGHGAQRVMDVNADEGVRFEISIPAPDTHAGQDVSGVVERVWFEDASVWRRDAAATYTYTQNALSAGRARDELRFVAGQDAVCYPSEQPPLWICVCGGANSLERGLCRVCGRDRAGTFENYNETAVTQAVKRREEEMNEKAQRAVRESSELEQARALLERRRRRKRRMIVAGVLCVALIGGFSLFYVLEGRDLFTYMHARGLFERGQYDRSREAFLSLEGYKDAQERAEDAEYQAALVLTAASTGEAVEEGIRRLEAIPSADAIEAAAQARIAQAAVYEQEGQYARAEELLGAVANYPEALEPLRRIGYQLALSARAAGDWAHAADRFEELGDYLDAPELFIPCQYEAAKKAMDDADYDDAIARFATVLDYEQSAEFTRECVYQIGQIMEEQGQYEGAAEKFSLLGVYRDSASRMLDCYYHAGLEAEEDGDYPTALSAYYAAGDYLDAKERYTQCALLLAQVKVENYEYAAAASLLESIENDEQSHQLWQQTVYKLAQLLYDEEEYSAAAERFDSLGNYQDASQRADLSRIEQARVLYESGEYQAAIAVYELLGENYGAEDLIQECRYEMAVAHEQAGEYEDARETYSLLGTYKDAARRALACGYELAKAQMDQGEYEAAYNAFAQLSGYEDAKAQAEAAAEAWLGEVKKAQEQAMAEKNYDEVIALLAPYVNKQLPETFEQLHTDYQEANYLCARALIDAGDRIGALPYLRAIPGYKDVDKLMKNDIYSLLGNWTTAEGAIAQFMEDGTCIIDGDTGIFRLSGYALLIGPDEENLARAYSITSIGTQKLTLKRERDGKTLRFTRQEN